MKILINVAILLAFLIDPGKIGQINKLKSEAKAAFMAGDFKSAIAKYKFLVDSLGVKEDEVEMNLANAYFKTQDTLNAFNSYLPVTESGNPRLKSIANQQLGVLSNRQGKFEEALNYFKQALKSAPTNEDARYNYEMVKKKLEEKKKQEQQNKDNKDNKDDKKDQKDKKDQQDKDKKDDQKDKKDKDDQKKDQEKKDQKDKQDQKDKKDQDKDQKEKDKQEKEKQDQDKKEKDKKDIPPSVSDKLKEMQMSEEKAKMILEAMKHQEIQYLQQNKRKASKPKDKGKPDW